MTENHAVNTTQMLAAKPADTYLLRLYVAGQTPNCMVAFANLKRICDEYLAGK